MQTKSKAKLGVKIALIFAVFTLFNPNVNIIDIFPDFIGFFILAKFFEKAADSAPYFEEARVNFTRLLYLSLLKFPALIVVLFARSNNTTDNDIIVLMALTYAIFEGLLSVMAIRDIFNALSYLGQRTSGTVLLKCRGMKSADELKTLSIVFAVSKCALYALPELMKLTRTIESEGQTVVLYGSRGYPYVLIAALFIGLIIGAIWLKYIISYINSVSKECDFNKCLASVASSYSEDEYEIKKKRRQEKFTFRLAALSSVLTLEIAFSNLSDINLFPRFIYATLFTIAVIRLANHNGRSRRRKAILSFVGILFILSSAVFFAFETSFLTEYGYNSLYLTAVDHEAYIAYYMVELFAIPELILNSVIAVLFLIEIKAMTDKIKAPLGPLETHSKQDRDYRRWLNKKSFILMILNIICGLLRFTNVFINGKIIMIATSSQNTEISGILVPSIPWFGSLVTAVTIIYIFYSYYYFSVIKDESMPDRN